MVVISWSSYPDDQLMTIISWWSWDCHETCNYEVVIVLMTSFWCHFGVQRGGFWKHFGVISSSKIVLRALWELCSCWKAIFRVPATPFWRILEASWEGFWRCFCMFFGYRFCKRLAFAFKMIFHWLSHLLDKQKWANSMGDPAKIQLSSC